MIFGTPYFEAAVDTYKIMEMRGMHKIAKDLAIIDTSMTMLSVVVGLINGLIVVESYMGMSLVF